MGFRGRQEYRQLKWNDITVEQDEHGRYLSFKERTTKTRQGDNGDTRDAAPKAYENILKPERCPVKLFEIYSECRPESMRENGTPFFLAINNMCSDPNNRKNWFKNGPLGQNRFGNMMKDMARETGLKGKLCNHSVRRTSLTNLLQAGVHPTVIKHISGHKRVESISHYATASKAQVKKMNDILLNPLENVPQYGQMQPKAHTSSASSSLSHAPNEKENTIALQAQPNETGSPIETISNMTQNKTAISGLLHNSTLNNCIFNFSYPMFEKK